MAQMVCSQYEFKGYDYSPLEKAKIDEIVDKMRELRKRQEGVVKQKQVRLCLSSRGAAERDEADGGGWMGSSKQRQARGRLRSR